MIRDCLYQKLNTNRIAMITALAKRFRKIQITSGRKEDSKAAEGVVRSKRVQSCQWDPKEIMFPTSNTEVVPVCLWKLSPLTILL